MSKTRMQEKQAIYERQWLIDPEQFNPRRNSRERERVLRTEKLLKDRTGKNVIDVGAGFGTFSLFLAERGWNVLATDIAENALKTIPEQENITKKQTALPAIDEPDNTFDLLLALEVIGEIDPRDFRLSVAEMSRLIKSEGQIMLSTAVDIYSDEAIPQLQALLETEFKIKEFHFSHHALQIRLARFFTNPKRFFSAFRNREEKKRELKKRKGFSALWYKINTSLPMNILWAPLSLLVKPLCYLLEQNSTVLLLLEKVTKLFMQERGISHLLCIATRRPLIEAKVEPPLPDRAPFRRERKWE